MQLCQYGPYPVDRCYSRMEHIPSDLCVDFSLHYAFPDDIFLIHVTCHSLKIQETYKITGLFVHRCPLGPVKDVICFDIRFWHIVAVTS